MVKHFHMVVAEQDPVRGARSGRIRMYMAVMGVKAVVSARWSWGMEVESDPSLQAPHSQ
ncbi:hypothetical protein EMIHUDRAFT_228686 [Emiliania huxleyi CCMP1516]|uniref:Uncharacterized protein n=2 Tax=Emiliania huxleyi TaxID=2903 RepID=A0A0D3KFF5_EMIH1|nr:hypothetical protein EMIHUDRAFT_228686 [Emiliania huxleyi CCMP1516]EOD34490.1 hypothetical protein EMIHUDRAFT_228686 [Emiliania huxleyi CCMP1516]|eukprot:XP_005786919.1 hypothetical protein EMIHUDRAFT_228686 [Emiliania huxleyi CCMP1516]